MSDEEKPEERLAKAVLSAVQATTALFDGLQFTPIQQLGVAIFFERALRSAFDAVEEVHGKEQMADVREMVKLVETLALALAEQAAKEAREQAESIPDEPFVFISKGGEA